MLGQSSQPSSQQPNLSRQLSVLKGMNQNIEDQTMNLNSPNCMLSGRPRKGHLAISPITPLMLNMPRMGQPFLFKTTSNDGSEAFGLPKFGGTTYLQ
jgi:hypothetical protein